MSIAAIVVCVGLLALLCYAYTQYSGLNEFEHFEKAVWSIVMGMCLIGLCWVVYKTYKAFKRGSSNPRKMRFGRPLKKTKRTVDFALPSRSLPSLPSSPSSPSRSSLSPTSQVLYVCATDATAALNPPKFSNALADYVFDDEQVEVVNSFLGEQVTEYDTRKCGARIEDPDLLTKCGYSVGQFRVVVLEHCPVALDDDSPTPGVLQFDQTFTNLHQLLTSGGLLIIPWRSSTLSLSSPSDETPLNRVVDRCESFGFRRVDLYLTPRFDLHIFQRTE